LVGPDATEDGADKTEEGGETDHAVNHTGEGLRGVAAEQAGKDAQADIDHRQHAGQEHGGIPGGDGDNVGGQPDVAIEHGGHHFEGIAVGTQMVGDDEGDEADHAGTGGTYAITEQALQHHPDEHRAPTDKDGGGIQIGDRRTALQIHAREHAEGMHHQCQH